jgi:hypothetical protein
LPPVFTLVSCSTYSSALKMEAICSSETSVDFQRTTLHYILGDSTLQDEFSLTVCHFLFYFPFSESKLIIPSSCVCVCVSPFQRLNHLIDFHGIRCERYATGDQTNLILINFLK